MNHEQLSIFKAVLLEVGMCEVSYVRSLDAPSQPRSAQFEENMRKLWQMQERSSHRIFKIPRRKWVAILVAILLLASFALPVSAIRKPIFSAFERVTEFFTEIIFPHRQGDQPIQEYQAEWIPEYFVLDRHSTEKNKSQTDWICDHGYMSLTQYGDGRHIHVDTENVAVSYVTWSSREIAFIQKFDTYLFSWEENGYFFTLACPTDIPMTDIRRIIESICPAQ